MPIHDWTRVDAGVFHHFHSSWAPELAKVLNAGGLPPHYYAVLEENSGTVGSDVLDMTPRLEVDQYAAKRDTLVIRHRSGDQIVALLEILSPGNKSSRHALRLFLEKACAAIKAGYRLLLVDLFPPGPRDPQGIHGAFWSEFEEDGFTLPPDKPLTLAS